ncbi:MAG: hypothetical protein NC177_05310 [Ruminococcus flavefaciens]|nr:hypothetical protein [Ruminococcus flavefaciens]
MDFSYKNIYGTEKYNEFIESKRYLIDEYFICETHRCKLSDGFSLEYDVFSDAEPEEFYNSDKTFISVVNLKKENQIIYKYCGLNSCEYGFYDIIRHKNGHRYYPFHVDMYGISFLDVDTLEVYNYIPEGYKHSNNDIYSESFMIDCVCYDIESNLVAYINRYENNFMIGDLSEPLDFNPHLISIHDILDCKDRIHFMKWENNRLYVLCGDEEKSVSVEEVRKLIDELTERYL